MRTLPSYFKIGDLGSFSANMSLLHGGSNNRMASTFVNLYDANKKLAVALRITDAWAGSKRCFLRASYYREDGSLSHHTTDYTYGDLNGVVTVRFNPLEGVLADVPGKGESSLYTHNLINTDRLLKYVVVQSYRYSSYAEHDDRIYNIRLSYAGSDYTVFHDSCNDVDNFVSMPEFPYGTRGEGELVSPSGQSYMTWDNIEAGGSSWHGPMYVHTLDRPFRLYQLSEFSVLGGLFQSSSTMGKTYVGLFDENKQIVSLVMWGDSWVGSQKGYFNVYFYPQDHSGASQSSGYLYTSFTKTGKLWWDPWMGGQGAIYTSIDGQGSAYPIVEVDNASRVIKYVGILGYRHSSYGLVDMRIHDINVVADLTRSNPNAPVPGESEVYDGTDEGIVCETTDFDDTLKQAESQVFSWWDPNSWWPILHMKMWVTIAEIFNMIHFSVDLLQSIRLVDLVGAKQPDDAINNGMIDLTMTMSIIATLQVGLASLAAAESLWSSYFVPTAAWCFLAVGITALVGASIWAFSYAGQNLEAEYWTHANAYFFFFGLFLTMLWIFIGYKSLTGVFTSALMGIYLVSLGMAITGLLDIIRDFCKTLKFTRLVALLLMAIFGLVAAHHYVRYYGGN